MLALENVRILGPNQEVERGKQ
uniref:Uncharacterized protein n=1 Tax=Arundo donax TaxID=35708 RepID=A0A0A8Z057_ARUDO